MVIVFSAVLMVLAVFLVKIVYNGYATAAMLIKREQAHWLAVAGLETAKVRLARNPGWYTDLPHYPESDDRWLKEEAVGEAQNLESGRFKVVREREKRSIYAVGMQGRAVVILRGAIK